MNNFQEKSKEVLDMLPDSFLGVLATSDGKEVGARTMSIFKLNGCFFFQTDINSEKAKHLSSQKRAAIGFENYEITGRCENIGHPFDEQNKEIMDTYRNHYSSAAKKYSYLPQEFFFRFVPETIKIWEYVDNEAQQTIVDFVNQTYICNKLGY